MGISRLLAAKPVPISAHCRELGLCGKRADVTKTGFLSVEISAGTQKNRFLGVRYGIFTSCFCFSLVFCAISDLKPIPPQGTRNSGIGTRGLMNGCRLRKGNVNRASKAESKTAPFFDSDRGSAPLARRRLARVETRSLHWHIETSDMDGRQRQTNVATSRLDLGYSCRLDVPGGHGSTRNEGIAVDYYRLCHSRLERIRGIEIADGDRALETNGDQCSRGEIVAILEWRISLSST